MEPATARFEEGTSNMGFKDLTPEELERRFASLGAVALDRFGIPADAPLLKNI